MRRLLLPLILAACAGPVDDALIVRHQGADLPVRVRGEAASTLILWESGGPSGPGQAERDVLSVDTRPLEDEALVAFYDRRGTGNAHGGYDEDDLGLDAALGDLDAVLAALEHQYRPERVVLAGHSFGTATTALHTAAHPDEVDGWVVVGPAVYHSDDAYLPYRRDMACRVATDQAAVDPAWQDAVAWCQEHPEVTGDGPAKDELWALLDRIYGELGGEPAIRTGPLLSTLFTGPYNVIDTLLRENRLSRPLVEDLRREDILGEVSDLDVPTVVITGEYDDITPTEVGHRLVEAVGPQATLVEMQGAGHYPMAQDPEAFADHVRTVLER